MRALAITGIVTAALMPSIISGSLMRATPPSRRMSEGTRSSAMTATAPASSAILACSGSTTSMITPPLSISASPRLTSWVPVSGVGEAGGGASGMGSSLGRRPRRAEAGSAAPASADGGDRTRPGHLHPRGPGGQQDGVALGVGEGGGLVLGRSGPASPHDLPGGVDERLPLPHGDRLGGPAVGGAAPVLGDEHHHVGGAHHL